MFLNLLIVLLLLLCTSPISYILGESWNLWSCHNILQRYCRLPTVDGWKYTPWGKIHLYITWQVNARVVFIILFLFNIVDWNIWHSVLGSDVAEFLVQNVWFSDWSIRRVQGILLINLCLIWHNHWSQTNWSINVIRPCLNSLHNNRLKQSMTLTW